MRKLITQSSAHNAQNLFLRIADITIALLSDDPELTFEVEGATKKFLVPEPDPDMRALVKWGDLSLERRGEMIFDSGVLWQLYAKNGCYIFRFTSHAIGSLPYKLGCFNHDFTSGEIYLHRPYFIPSQPVYPLEYPLDELLFMNLLARGKGIEVHACGVVDSNGNGHLFVGQSEAGKTTMARLWQNEPNITVLSDDRIILRKMENAIWMYGTPWHGEAMLASPSRAPLTAVYFLEKGQKNELVAQKPPDSISRLFSCSFPPFYNRDALDFTLGFLEEVVKNIPCYELRFKPDKSVVELITSKE